MAEPAYGRFREAGKSRSSGANGDLRWGAILKGLIAVQLARAAERVLNRRHTSAAAGRLGGSAGSATLPPPSSRLHEVARVAPPPADEKPTTGERAEPHAPGDVLSIGKRIFQEFGKDNGSLMSAAVAFYLVLSLVPLVLVAVSLVGLFLGNNPQAHESVFRFVDQFMGQRQGSDLIRTTINGIIEKRGLVGGIGLATLFLTATGGFATLETAINATWGMPNRSFIKNKLFAFAMVFLIGALFLLSIAATAAVDLAGRLPGLGWLAQHGGLQVVGWVLPIFISGMTFTAVFKLFPNTRTTWKPSLIAGFVTALFWEAFKVAYALYSAHAGDQSAQYGALAGFVGLIIWISYSSTLVLLGSELAWVLNGCPSSGKDAKKIGPRRA